MQGNAVIVSRAAAKAREAANASYEKSADIEDEMHNGTTNATVEQNRYINFWIGVQKSLQIKHLTKKPMDPKMRNRFKNLDEKVDKTILLPDNTFKINWDFFICLLIMFSVIMVPYRIGFDSHPEGGMVIFDYCMDVCFFIDMIITFNTAFVDNTDERMVTNRSKIAIHYLKIWFWIDLISTVPFDVILSFVMDSSHLSSIRLIRMLRLFRLFKLSRLVNLEERISAYRLPPSLVSIFTLIIQIFFVAHVFACFWHFIAMPDANPKEPPRTWLTVYGFENVGNYERYVVSLYYIIVTMLTVGYGDIHPTNFSERIYGIATMLVGGIVFGALISKVARLIDSRNPQAKAFKANMDELKAFMEEIALPNALKIKTKEAYAYYLNKKSSFGESGIFSELPKPVLYKLVFQLYKKDFTAIKLLKTYDAAFVVDLVIHARPFQAMKDEIIFGEGDVCNDIVLISRGSVKITTTDGVRDILCGVVTDGGYFGDFEYYRNTTAIASYTAMKSCDLLCVNHAVFNKVIGESFDAGTNFKAALKKRYNAFMNILKQPVGKEISHVTPQKKGILSRMKSNANMKMSLAAEPTPTNETKHHHHSHTSHHDAAVLSVTHIQKQKSTYMRGKGHLWVDGHVQNPTQSQKIAMEAHSNPEFSDEDPVMTFRVILHIEGNKMIMEMEEIYLETRRILHPEGYYKMQWDFFIGFWIVYSVLVVPVEIAFGAEAYSGSETVNMVANGFFFLDICANFRTAYYVADDDALEVSPRFIAWNYAAGWLFIDLISTIPFDAVISVLISGSRGNTLKFTQMLKIVRLFRLFKLARLMKMSSYMEKVEDISGINPAIFDLIIMLLEVYVIAHWIACVWWGLCSVLTRDTWMENTDMVYQDMTLAPLANQYIVSLYWTFTTVTTVGYGDIYGLNSKERLLNIFIILMGASIFGYMIANVSGLIDNFNQSAAKKSERLSEITEYLNEKQCPALLQDKVTSHFKNLFHETSAFDVDRILSRLPHTISNDILMVQHKKKMGMIAIFNYIPNESVCLYLFQLMTPIFFERDKFVLKEGRESTEIMFLVSGKASAYRKTPARKPKQTSFYASPQKAQHPSPKKERPNTFVKHMSRKLTLDNGNLEEYANLRRAPSKDHTASNANLFGGLDPTSPDFTASYYKALNRSRSQTHTGSFDVMQDSAGKGTHRPTPFGKQNSRYLSIAAAISESKENDRLLTNKNIGSGSGSGLKLGGYAYNGGGGSPMAKSGSYKYDKSINKQVLDDAPEDIPPSLKKSQRSVQFGGDKQNSVRFNASRDSTENDNGNVIRARSSSSEIEGRVMKQFGLGNFDLSQLNLVDDREQWEIDAEIHRIQRSASSEESKGDELKVEDMVATAEPPSEVVDNVAVDAAPVNNDAPNNGGVRRSNSKKSKGMDMSLGLQPILPDNASPLLTANDSVSLDALDCSSSSSRSDHAGEGGTIFMLNKEKSDVSDLVKLMDRRQPDMSHPKVLSAIAEVEGRSRANSTVNNRSSNAFDRPRASTSPYRGLVPESILRIATSPTNNSNNNNNNSNNNKSDFPSTYQANKGPDYNRIRTSSSDSTSSLIHNDTVTHTSHNSVIDTLVAREDGSVELDNEDHEDDSSDSDDAEAAARHYHKSIKGSSMKTAYKYFNKKIKEITKGNDGTVKSSSDTTPRSKSSHGNNASDDEGGLRNPYASEEARLRFKPFHKWSTADMLKKKYTHIGHIYPGDFVGHLGMMNRTPHQGTVRALETCIVYALSKTEIGKLIRREPTVALLLQNALVEATKAQSAVLGKFHMRKNRAEFMKKELKARFYNLYKTHKRRLLYLPTIPNLPIVRKSQSTGSVEKLDTSNNFHLSASMKVAVKAVTPIDDTPRFVPQIPTPDPDQKPVVNRFGGVNKKGLSINTHTPSVFGSFGIEEGKDGEENDSERNVVGRHDVDIEDIEMTPLTSRLDSQNNTQTTDTSEKADRGKVSCNENIKLNKRDKDLRFDPAGDNFKCVPEKKMSEAKRAKLAKQAEERRIHKKAVDVEHLLTSKNMLYDSDRDEEAVKAKMMNTFCSVHTSETAGSLPQTPASMTSPRVIGTKTPRTAARHGPTPKSRGKVRRKSMFDYAESKEQYEKTNTAAAPKPKVKAVRPASISLPATTPTASGTPHHNSLGTVATVAVAKRRFAMFKRRGSGTQIVRPEFKPLVKYNSCPDLRALENELTGLGNLTEEAHRRQSYPSLTVAYWKLDHLRQGIV